MTPNRFAARPHDATLASATDVSRDNGLRARRDVPPIVLGRLVGLSSPAPGPHESRGRYATSPPPPPPSPAEYADAASHGPREFFALDHRRPYDTERPTGARHTTDAYKAARRASATPAGRSIPEEEEAEERGPEGGSSAPQTPRP